MEKYRAIIKEHQKEYLEKINWRDIKNLLEENGLMPPDCREAHESQRMSVLIEVTLKSNNESDLHTILTILDKQIMNMKTPTRESPITNDGDEDEYRNNASSLSTSHVKIEEDGSSDGHGWKDEIQKLSMKVDAMQKEHEKAKAEKKISDKKIATTVSKIGKMTKEIDALKKTNERLEKKIASHEKELQEKSENIKSLKQDIKDAKKALEKEKKTNKNKSDKIDVLETKVNDLEKEVSDLEKEVSDREQEVAREKKARDQDRTDYEQNLKSLQEEFQKLKSDVENTKSKVCLLM